MKEFLGFFGWFLASGLILLLIIALISFLINIYNDSKREDEYKTDAVDFENMRLKQEIFNLHAEMIQINKKIMELAKGADMDGENDKA